MAMQSTQGEREMFITEQVPTVAEMSPEYTIAAQAAIPVGTPWTPDVVLPLYKTILGLV